MAGTSQPCTPARQTAIPPAPASTPAGHGRMATSAALEAAMIHLSAGTHADVTPDPGRARERLDCPAAPLSATLDSRHQRRWLVRASVLSTSPMAATRTLFPSAT